MIQNIFFLAFLFCIIPRCQTADTATTYMEDICGQEFDVVAGTVGHVELTKKLQYANDIRCSVTLVPRRGLKIVFKRFDVEDNCNDSLLVLSSSSQNGSSWTNMYDGPLCGTKTPEPRLVTGGKVLLVFSSDTTAGYRGFELQYIGYLEAPCEENMFVCDKIVCISNQFRCDGTTTCEDGTDEKECTLDDSQNSTRIGIIVGSVVGALLVALFVVVLSYKLYYRHKRKQFALQVRTTPELLYKGPEYLESSYPVTDKYRKKYSQMDDEGRMDDFQKDMEYDYYFRQLGRRTAFNHVYSMKNDWEMARNWAKNSSKPKGANKKKNKDDDTAPLPMSPDTSAFSYEGADNTSPAATRPESKVSATTDMEATLTTKETKVDSQ